MEGVNYFMEAGRLWFLGDFIGTNKVLFQIPVYQRNYDWSQENCNRLLDDIKEIINTGEKHFLGTIVFMAAKETGFSLREYTIIDGQQRLTTMMLLLKALSDVAKIIGDECEEEIQDSYIHNKHCAEEFKVKLKPIKTDNDQFLALLQDKIEELDTEGNIYLNYEICKKTFEKWVNTGITPTKVLQALEKLEIVQIVLEKGIDDPQVIFESINSTGLELSTADLIRNFLLMNADDQEKLYEDYWLYIEKMLKPKNDYSNLKLFFLQYIIYKTNAPVNDNRLYEKFVKMYKENNYTQESCLKELKYYADIFNAFVNESARYSDKIKKALRSLRQLKQTTCYPFFFHIFDDYEQGIISIEILEQIVQFILSYLLRRIVCGVPSNSLRGMFIYLYSRVFKVSTNKRKYYESINKFLFTINTKDVFPGDKEFERALNTTNVYGNTALCRFLLVDIENGDSKETLNVAGLTVEHIMPQTLGVEWNYISQEKHDEYLDVLGNLSVSGYNSELSNKSFSEKKKIIKDNSKAVILNSDVWDRDTWNISDIISRGHRLSKIILKRYKVERIMDNDIEFEYVTTITLDDIHDVTGKKLVNFKFDGEIYRQNKYAPMLVDMIKLLDKRTPGVIERLAKNNFSYNVNKNKHSHISLSSKEMRWPWEVKEGIYIEANLSSWGIMKFIDSLMEQYNLDKSLFSISVVAEVEEEDE